MVQIRVTLVEASGIRRELADGTPGQSLMELARAHGVVGILAECGGLCACATCHVYVDEAWWPRVGEADDVEFSMLDLVGDALEDTSRLACQIKLRSELNGLVAYVAPPPATKMARKNGG